VSFSAGVFSLWDRYVPFYSVTMALLVLQRQCAEESKRKSKQIEVMQSSILSKKWKCMDTECLTQSWNSSNHPASILLVTLLYVLDDENQ